VSQHLQPFVPDASHPFDERAAAHLLRRTGFGAAPTDVAKAVAAGFEAAVDQLFEPADDEEAEFQRTFAGLEGFINLGDVSYIQAWWAHRMLHSRVPLREKLTLFWHGHFATSFLKVEDSYLMHRQIETIRRLADGSFRDLVLAVARDPAMLVYLDGESNTKEHPNENFARELMELFTCGIGHYTEKDVQEAARAFSGWHRNAAEFVFNADDHDTGRKKLWQYTGRFDGTDVIDLLMQQTATRRRLAERLLRFFATEQPEPEVIDEAAQILDRTQMNIKWFLRELFLSSYFYSEKCYRRRISSPAEYVVGTARTLGLRISGVELKEYMTSMGQQLFAPPNVKGWDGEQKWINSNYWSKRREYAVSVANLASDTPFNPNLSLEEIVPADMTDPQQVIERLAEVLLQGELDKKPRSAMAELLVMSGDGPNPQAFREDQGFRQERTRVVLSAMLSLPEYHAF
jgi:uncharacterized protein (DUF1800 family)